MGVQLKDTSTTGSLNIYQAIFQFCFDVLRSPCFCCVVTIVIPLYSAKFIRDAAPESIWDEEVEADLITNSVKVFTVYVCMIFIAVNLVQTMNLNTTKAVGEYVCSSARSLWRDPVQLNNHSVDFQRCIDQKVLIKAVWSEYFVIYAPIVGIMFAASTDLIRNIRKPEGLKVMKTVHLTFSTFYLRLVWKFQESFESVSRFSAFVDSFVIAVFFVFAVFVMSLFVHNIKQLNHMLRLVMTTVGVFLTIHAGFNGWHLVKADHVVPLPTLLLLYYFAIFCLMCARNDLPAHTTLAMSIFVLPPICPFVVTIATWCLDKYWRDLTTEMPSRNNFSEPSIPRFVTHHRYNRQYDEDYRPRRRGYRRVRTRAAHPIRGLL